MTTSTMQLPLRASVILDRYAPAIRARALRWIEKRLNDENRTDIQLADLGYAISAAIQETAQIVQRIGFDPRLSKLARAAFQKGEHLSTAEAISQVRKRHASSRSGAPPLAQRQSRSKSPAGK